jgi:hypothetical protein
MTTTSPCMHACTVACTHAAAPAAHISSVIARRITLATPFSSSDVPAYHGRTIIDDVRGRGRGDRPPSTDPAGPHRKGRRQSIGCVAWPCRQRWSSGDRRCVCMGVGCHCMIRDPKSKRRGRAIGWMTGAGGEAPLQSAERREAARGDNRQDHLGGKGGFCSYLFLLFPRHG